MTDTEILDSILAKEGGFVNHPLDRGGPTNMGITLRTLSAWLGRIATLSDIQSLTPDMARTIYTHTYLHPFSGVAPEAKGQVVDMAVLHGVGNAKGLLAAAEADTRPLPTALVVARVKFIGRIVEADHSQAVFLNGWINRALSFLE